MPSFAILTTTSSRFNKTAGIKIDSEIVPSTSLRMLSGFVVQKADFNLSLHWLKLALITNTDTQFGGFANGDRVFESTIDKVF